MVRFTKSGCLRNSTTECGRLRTPKWPYLASSALVSWRRKTDGMSFSRPSGRPSFDAQIRVKPVMSVHGPSAAACFFQWKYMIRDCQPLYVVPCPVSSVWYGRRFGQLASALAGGAFTAVVVGGAAVAGAAVGATADAAAADAAACGAGVAAAAATAGAATTALHGAVWA